MVDDLSSAMDGENMGTPVAAPDGRMLLVEDDEINQIVALGILGQLGYEVDVANSGEEALQMAQSRSYQAVFMDCQMPGMDGYEVTRRWRERERGRPGDPHTPIVAMTASVESGARERCLAAGMDDYLIKPIRRDTVTTSLARWTGTAIDREQIDELRSLGTGHDSPLAEIIRSFLEEAPGTLDELSGAVARGDTGALSPLAHSLKGSASAVGATAMTELCANMGGHGRAGDLGAAMATLTQLRADYERVRGELERIGAEPK